MKFFTYTLSKFNSLLSYIDAVKSFGNLDQMAEESKVVSYFDLDSGSSEFQHGSFERLQNSNLSSNAIDHQDLFTDAIHEAPDALTNYEDHYKQIYYC
jgi:hypothetical protein